MTLGVVDLQKIIDDATDTGKIMTAMGGTIEQGLIPEVPGQIINKGAITNDMAALLQATSSVGVPQRQLPATSLDKLPTPGGM